MTPLHQGAVGCGIVRCGLRSSHGSHAMELLAASLISRSPTREPRLPLATLLETEVTMKAATCEVSSVAGSHDYVTRLVWLSPPPARYFGSVGVDVEIVTEQINYFEKQTQIASLASELTGLEDKSPYIQVEHRPGCWASERAGRTRWGDGIGSRSLSRPTEDEIGTGFRQDSNRRNSWIASNKALDRNRRQGLVPAGGGFVTRY